MSAAAFGWRPSTRMARASRAVSTLVEFVGSAIVAPFLPERTALAVPRVPVMLPGDVPDKGIEMQVPLEGARHRAVSVVGDLRDALGRDARLEVREHEGVARHHVERYTGGPDLPDIHRALEAYLRELPKSIDVDSRCEGVIRLGVGDMRSLRVIVGTPGHRVLQPRARGGRPGELVHAPGVLPG